MPKILATSDWHMEEREVVTGKRAEVAKGAFALFQVPKGTRGGLQQKSYFLIHSRGGSSESDHFIKVGT